MTKIVWLVVLASSIGVYAQRYDVVIDEIMSDPSPAVGLPGVEWIELRNVSSVAVSVLGWRIADALTLSGPFSSFMLMPDSTVIICSNSSAAVMSTFGRVIAVSSFPSLDNDGEQLILKDHLSRTIHSVSYQKKWYSNSLKQEGGWSLEMIDPHLPCGGASNWKASIDPAGGTPGRINSANAVGQDDEPPVLLNGYAEDSVTLILQFDEPLDSNIAVGIANYQMDPMINIISAEAMAPSFDKVKLQLSSSIAPSVVHKINVSRLCDCERNEMTSETIRIGLSETAQPKDVIINEILFDNPPSTTDYIEFFNRSNKIIDAKKLYLSNRTNGVLNAPTIVSSAQFLLFPGDYIVISEEVESLALSYHLKYPRQAITSSLPTFSDTEGTAVLLNAQGDIIDELGYKDEWHFSLLTEKEGVALERISAESVTNDRNNWTSASYTSGYGTPGYLNSQSLQNTVSKASITVHPRIVSPDNDGRDDHVKIVFEKIPENTVANIYIFDLSGKLKRHLLNNRTISSGSFIMWDGLGEDHERLMSGIHIILIELFDLSGHTEKHKSSVVVAGRIN